MLFFTATETSDVVYQLRMSCELGEATSTPQVPALNKISLLHVAGRVASRGALAPEPPRATRSQTEFTECQIFFCSVPGCFCYVPGFLCSVWGKVVKSTALRCRGHALVPRHRPMLPFANKTRSSSSHVEPTPAPPLLSNGIVQ